MFSMKRPSQNTSSSVPDVTKSYEDRPLYASNGPYPQPVAPTSLSQRFSNAAAPSTNFLVPDNEFGGPHSLISHEESPACAAQMETDNGTHGSMDPTSFEFEQSKGYLPVISYEAQPPPSRMALRDSRTTEMGRPSFESFLQVISTERLSRMPHRASRWDRIIRGLENFVIHVSALTAEGESASSTRSDTASQIYAACFDLLRFSSREPEFLDLAVPILSVVDKCLSTILRDRDCLTQSDRVQNVMDLLFVSVLEILNGLLTYGHHSAPDSHQGLALFYWSIGIIHDRREQLLDEAWASQLPPTVLGSRDSVGQISRMRNWLKPSDPIVRIVSINLQAARSLHVEFTCEWFARPLLEFIRSSDKVFWIESPPGGGKSMLYSWIVDSLKNQVGGQDYIVLDYSLDPLLPSETGPQSLLRGLLGRVFEQFPGLTSLYSSLAEVMNRAASADDISEVTEALWGTFGVVTQSISEQSVIVVDGVTDLKDSDFSAEKCLQRLCEYVSKTSTTRLVLLSRPFNQPIQMQFRRFAIQHSHVREDIHRVIDQAKGDYPEMQPEITDWVLTKANGNFMWALLTLQLWRLRFREGSPPPLKSLPTTLDATASSLVSQVDFSDATTRLLLLASLVAVRPLRIEEIQALLSIDLATGSLGRQDQDIIKAVDQGCMSIIVIDDNIIRLRHPIFRRSLREVALTRLKQSVKDLHSEMTARLLLYLRLAITDRSELTLKSISTSVVEDTLRSQRLATYALRYWTRHYEQSDLTRDAESLNSDQALGFYFPQSTFLAALEAAFWASQPLWEAIPALQVARAARQDILGSHLATLQTTALLAVHYKSVRMFTDAVTSFAGAFELAQQQLPEFHEFAVNCVTECLDSVQSTGGTATFDLPVTVPEMLQYLIAKFDRQSGPGNDRSLERYQQLARHYADMDQYGLSTRIYRDIYKLTMSRFGKSSSQAKTVAGDLAALLHKSDQSDQPEDHSQYNEMIYDNVVDTLPVTDRRRIKASITRAETWKTQKHPLSAELEYLTLLHGITGSPQDQGDDEIQQNLARISLQYATFLMEQSRAAEAQNILVGLWTSLYKKQTSVSSYKGLLKDVAKGFHRAGLPATALNVLSFIAEYSEESTDIEVEETFSRITEELTGSYTSIGAPLPKSTEDALLQSFESAKSRGRPAMSASVIKICQSLIKSLVLQKRWRDVIYVACSVLELLWPAAVDDTGEAPIPGEFEPVVGDMAIELAQAYDSLGSRESASQLYWYVFRSAKSSSLKDSPIFADIAQAAFKSLEKTGQTKRMIQVAQELLRYHRLTCSEVDPPVIDQTYVLASLFSETGEIESATSGYKKIVDSLDMQDHHDQRALPALQALLLIYRSKKLWNDARKVYSGLWRNFLSKGKDYEIQEDTARTLFREYLQLLEDQSGTDDQSVHNIREEYLRGCQFAFGERSRINLEATMNLANYLERNSTDKLEAIRLYERLVDLHLDDVHALEPDVVLLLEQTEATLREYYSHRLSSKMDGQALRRAILLEKKRSIKLRDEYGTPSPQSLSSLAKWVAFLTKEGSLQSRNVATQELKQAVDSVLQSDQEGKALFDSATILASSYAEGDYVDEGLDTAQALREQMIFQESKGNDYAALKGSETNARSKLIFLTAFETRMSGSMETFTAVHSRSLLEMALWESFQTMDLTTSSHEEILIRGASLLAMLKDHYPSYKGEMLQQRLLDLFMEEFGAAFTNGAQVPRKFVSVLTRAMSKERGEVDVPYLACAAINEEAQRLVDQRQFTELLEVCAAGFDFIRFTGAYEHDPEFEYGLQLGLILGEVGPRLCSEQTVNKQMLELSKLITREVLQLCRTNDFNLETIHIEELSRVAAILGKQQNYHDLEWLLNRLWLSRHKRGPLSQDMVVNLGRRLVDVRFFHGHVESAIELAEDILYNLRQVYGPSHPSAIQMMNLLSSMYMSKGDRAAAMAVHEGVDSDIAKIAFDDRIESVVQEDPSQAGKSVRSKIEYLLQCYQNSDGSERFERQSSSLIDELTKRLGASAGDSKKGPLESHKPPTNWSFAGEGEKDQLVRFEESA